MLEFSSQKKKKKSWDVEMQIVDYDFLKFFYIYYSYFLVGRECIYIYELNQTRRFKAFKLNSDLFSTYYQNEISCIRTFALYYFLIPIYHKFKLLNLQFMKMLISILYLNSLFKSYCFEPTKLFFFNRPIWMIHILVLGI